MDGSETSTVISTPRLLASPLLTRVNIQNPLLMCLLINIPLINYLNKTKKKWEIFMSKR